MCAHCLARGLVTAAIEVDHVVPLFKGGADDESNLQSLCRECHDTKTRLDLGWKVKGGCDLNGNPLDSNHFWNKGRGR